VTDRFKIGDEARSFVEQGDFGLRYVPQNPRLGKTDLSPVSTMRDLYEIVKESDRAITF
jgi:hypothetical protein